MPEWIFEVLGFVVLVTAFFGLVAYRTYQDRREERRKRDVARLS